MTIKDDESDMKERLLESIDQWLSRLLPLLVILCMVIAVVLGVRFLRPEKKLVRQRAPVVVMVGDTCAGFDGCLHNKVTISSDQLFEFNSFKISSQGVHRLEIEASKLEKERVTRILVVGHADGLGLEAANDRISLERAEAVRSVLIKNLSNVEVLAVGVGDHDQVKGANECVGMSDKERRTCLAPNRRVQIWFQAS